LFVVVVCDGGGHLFLIVPLLGLLLVVVIVILFRRKSHAFGMQCDIRFVAWFTNGSKSLFKTWWSVCIERLFVRLQCENTKFGIAIDIDHDQRKSSFHEHESERPNESRGGSKKRWSL